MEKTGFEIILIINQIKWQSSTLFNLAINEAVYE